MVQSSRTDRAVPPLSNPGERRGFNAVLAAARALSAETRWELADRLNHELAVGSGTTAHGLDRVASSRARLVAALRSAADFVGHPPSQAEYQAEAKRQADL